MAVQESPLRREIVRPAKRGKRAQGASRRKVAGPLKALVGPRNLSQALDRAVPPPQRRAIAQTSGYDGQAQKLTFEPYLRALLVRQIMGGTLHDLQHGMAVDPLYEVHGARLEISVPGLSKANAQRPTQPFWEVLADVMAAVEALPQAVRIGRDEPLGAATPKQLREIGQLLERTQIFDATTLELPPQIARWARTSTKQERAGIKVQLRLRAGYGGMDRVMVTGAKGNDNPYFGALLDLESAAPGQVYLFDTGYCKLATYDQIREHGGELVTVLHKSITVEVVEERAVATPVTAQGYVIHSDRLVHLGKGDTRSRYLWRVIDATDTQGRRRTILTSLLLDETAERITQLRAYRWTIEIVFRWLKRVLKLDEVISVSPKGVELQVAVALMVYGLMVLYHAGGALSLTALQRRIKTDLNEAIFAAGVAEGRRQERARAAAPGPPPSLLRAVG
jgi:Transposase DDE domain